jgi:DNA-binding transcriptional regulator YhcF (GntR family)
MSTGAIQLNQRRSESVTCAGPSLSPPDKVEKQKQLFRSTIEPIVYRARQLGLNRVQIREVIMSLL